MDNVLQLLGLAYRARKTVLGEEVLKQIKKVKILFIASDASEKSRERYEKKCSFYEIPHIDRFDGSQLSEALGKRNVKFVGITDQGFARTLLNKI
ncbi:MAG: ribosomal L7Ae/L30e/S12e/Gadd45 family protein [Erysipelotrichaceae bacterium]|nr:ribosomal L7Ae/L30e/S12e/Gadd45 family protein [Erysipelotrichaceae bacterium]